MVITSSFKVGVVLSSSRTLYVVLKCCLFSMSVDSLLSLLVNEFIEATGVLVDVVVVGGVEVDTNLYGYIQEDKKNSTQ